MKLYDFPYSPNCRKVRAVAYELGIDLELAPLNLVRRESKTPAFLEKNPNGRVPVLEDGDFVLWESNAILAYLATKHGANDLLPKDARGRAEVDRWLSWQLAHLAPAISKVAFELIVKKLTGQGPPDEAAIKVGAEEFRTFSAVLDGWLAKREYVAGKLSIADFALAAHYSLAPACALDLAPYANVRAVEPLRPALRLHCYRMLGSSCDSDDVMQEVLLRAWRAKDSLENVAAMRGWLYRIATNACLDELRDRKGRPLPSDLVPEATDPFATPSTGSPEVTWLEPCPDGWVQGVVRDPGAAYEVKESVALAFVAALQCLSARERAVLLLRDVLGLSAEETASSLEMSVPSANSTLHRARVALRERVGGDAQNAVEVTSDFDEELLRKYLRAWETLDLPALVELLAEDITVTMPPSPTWLKSKASAGAFIGARPFKLLAGAPFKLVPIRANGQPAFAFYVGDALHGVQILRIRGGRVVEMHHFMDAKSLAAFGATSSSSS